MPGTPVLSLWMKFRYKAKNKRLKAKKLAILRTLLFIIIRLLDFNKIGFSDILMLRYKGIYLLARIDILIFVKSGTSTLYGIVNLRTSCVYQSSQSNCCVSALKVGFCKPPVNCGTFSVTTFFKSEILMVLLLFIASNRQ